jgi:hypothetical protein
MQVSHWQTGRLKRQRKEQCCKEKAITIEMRQGEENYNQEKRRG